jgi:predicted site-specific integrase-resolvase
MLLEAHRGPDGDQYVTRKHAAELMGVTPATITTWIRKGYLKPLDGCPPKLQLFRLEDVAVAEKAAHDAAVRTSGTSARVERNFIAA